MSKWKEVRLGEVVEDTQYGFTTSSTENYTGIKFLRITDIVDYFIDWESVPYCNIDEKNLKKYRIYENDLLIARTGATAGVYKVIDSKFYKNTVFASYLIRFKLNKNLVNPLYINYCLGTELYKNFIKNYISGSAQPNINAKILSRFKFKIPDLETQEKIAQVLSSYDELIENNNRRIELLEKMAEEIYKEWFVRMRFPGHDQVRFDKGIPEGWEVKKIGEFIPIKTGKKDANYGTEDGEYLFFTCAQEPIRANDYSFDDHAILLAGNGDLNVKMYRGKFEAYQRTYVLVPYDNKYIYLLYFNILENISRLINQAAGTVIRYLTKGMIEKISFLNPNENILEKFNLIIGSIYDELELLNKQNQNLIKQRDMLLPRLMNGTIEVE